MSFSMPKYRFSNSKLNIKIIDKLMQASFCVRNENGDIKELKGLTSTEIDLLFLLAHKQNAFGHVRDLYYLDAATELNVCTESFYNAIRGLEEKGFIYASSNGSDGFWNFTIINNIFLHSEHDKQGYLDISLDIFNTPNFKSLKANEKKLVIKLVRSADAHKGIKVVNLAKSIGVTTISHVYKYLENIKKLIDLKVVQGAAKEDIVLFNFVPIKEIETERERFIKNLLVKLGRIYKLKELNDPGTFIQHFKGLLGKFNVYYEAIGLTRFCYIVAEVFRVKGLNQAYLEWDLSRMAVKLEALAV